MIMPNPMVVVILGMHKSGSTLVAKALHEAGIVMLPPGYVLAEGVAKNGVPKEKYEWPAFKEINYRLLGAKPHDSLGIDLRAPLHITLKTDAEARALIDGCGLSWGFKDPRTTLTYDFWYPMLPPHRVIAVHRDPREILQHYITSGDIKSRQDAFNANRHNLFYEERVEQILATADGLLLEYRALMTDDHEWGRLEDFVGRDLPDARDPALYHERVERWQ